MPVLAGSTADVTSSEPAMSRLPLSSTVPIVFAPASVALLAESATRVWKPKNVPVPMPPTVPTVPDSSSVLVAPAADDPPTPPWMTEPGSSTSRFAPGPANLTP
jgi:hypothetical protein